MRKFHFTLVFSALLLLVIGLSVSWTDHHMDETAKNKEMVHRVYDQALNNGNFAPLEESVDASFVRHGNPQVKGPEGLKGLITMHRNAFPDISMTIDDQIAEGDKVVSRWTAVGTHTGEMMGIPPTGKKATVTGISIDRIADGKIVEEWENFDELGMMQQLGLIPMPEGTD